MKNIPYKHIILFLLTFISTLFIGALHEGVDLGNRPLDIYRGLPFSLTLLCILLAHEFSHYIASRKHNVEASLPYFIPAPTLFGTLGAFIKMKSPITTKNALMDIGASGPIAGFIISIAATIVGLLFSDITSISGKGEVIILGDSLLFSFLSRLIVGAVPENYDVMLHPIAFAGWIGFFVTSLNLIPVGQLDGGHIAYAVLGEKHEKISKILVAVMVILGFIVFNGWLVWAVLLLILGLRHPPIIYPEIPLDEKRKRIGWATMIIFILTFIPMPIRIQ